MEKQKQTLYMNKNTVKSKTHEHYIGYNRDIFDYIFFQMKIKFHKNFFPAQAKNLNLAINWTKVKDKKYFVTFPYLI